MYRLTDKHEMRRLPELFFKNVTQVLHNIRIVPSVTEWALLQTLLGSSENRIHNFVSLRRLEKFRLGASLSGANNEKNVSVVK